MTTRRSRAELWDMDFLSQQVGPLTAGQWVGAVIAFVVVSSIFSLDLNL